MPQIVLEPPAPHWWEQWIREQEQWGFDGLAFHGKWGLFGFKIGGRVAGDAGYLSQQPGLDDAYPDFGGFEARLRSAEVHLAGYFGPHIFFKAAFAAQTGGVGQRDTTLALNWYLSEDLRVMVDFTTGYVDALAEGRFRVLQSRQLCSFCPDLTAGLVDSGRPDPYAWRSLWRAGGRMKDLRGDFPRSIEGISLEWLNGALSDWGEIRACRCEAHPEQGVTSQVYVLHLQCARGGRLQPQRVLVKLATDSAAARDALTESRAFRREIDFYRELGGRAGIAVPRCYALGYDEADHSFLLLLEYLGDCSVRDVLVGTVGEVTTAVDALAGFHARWWGRAAELPFIQREGDEAQLRNRLARLDVALDNIRAHHRGEVGETLIELLELFIPHAALLAAEARSGPLTLCHGDYHRKQLLFPDNDAGRFCVIDWQTVCIDRGANDLARIVVTGLTGAQRRRHETALVERYHRRLCDAGVEDYPLEQLWQHYALGIARLLAIHSLVFTGFDIAPLIQQWRDKGADWYEVLFRWPAEAAAERGIQGWLSDFIERLPGAAPRVRALRAGP